MENTESFRGDIAGSYPGHALWFFRNLDYFEMAKKGLLNVSQILSLESYLYDKPAIF